MKRVIYFLISLITILAIFGLVIFVKNYLSLIKTSKVTSSPFNLLEVLDTKIKLKNNLRTYDTKVDCTKIKNINDQILYYRLNDYFKESKINVSTKLFNNNEVLEEEFEEITNLEINISIQDKEKKYEQIYHINAVCQENIDTLGN